VLGLAATSSIIMSYAQLRKATISVVMSVCLFAWNNTAATGWIFVKFYIGDFIKIYGESPSFG
jgi:hypothetical protein